MPNRDQALAAGQRLAALRHNRAALLLAALIGAIMLTMAGLFTVPAIAAFGAFTTLIIGIAAQQSLGNVFAGILIALTRPFKVGDGVSTTIMANPIEGKIHAIGIVFTEVATDDGPIVYLPNSLVLTVPVFVRSV